MAKLEPMVIICFPETTKNTIDFHFKLLPKWIQLYILRWWERQKGGEKMCQKQQP